MIGNLASVKYQIISSTRKLPFPSQHSSHKHLTNNVTQRVHCPAGTGGGHYRAVPPQTKIVPPHARIVPEEINRLGATEVQFEA